MRLPAQVADAGRALRDDVRVVIKQFGRQDIFFHAGAVAYSALLAGVPFLLLLASALGFVLRDAPAVSYETLQQFLGELLPAAAVDAAVPLLQGVLADAEAKRTALGLVGAPLFIWFSTRFFGALRASLISVFGLERGRGFLHGKLLDMMYVSVGTLLVTAYLGINAYLALGTRVGAALMQTFSVDPDTIGFLEFFIGRLIATSFLALMFAALYKFLPNRHVRFSSAAWGGVWGVALFELTRNVIFELVTRIVNPASLYSGTLAAIVIVVFWAYYAAVVFLIGGVVARVHEMRSDRQMAPEREML